MNWYKVYYENQLGLIGVMETQAWSKSQAKSLIMRGLRPLRVLNAIPVFTLRERIRRFIKRSKKS